MTNNGIKTRDVLEALDQDNPGWQDKNEFTRLSYREFIRACHQIDIADPRTIKQKWEILVDKDILKSATKYCAIVDLRAFFDALGVPYSPQNNTHTHTHTKTLTQCDTGGEQ